MTRVEVIHGAIRRAYEAALDPDGLPQALTTFADAVDADKSMLNLSKDGGFRQAVSVGLDHDSAQRLRRELETRTPSWIQAIPVGTVQKQSSSISDADFMRSELYNEAVRPAGGFYAIVAPIVRTESWQVLVSLGRTLGAPDFSDPDLEAARLIEPHLKNALDVQRRIAVADQRARAALAVFDQLDVGVILFDAGRRPIFANERAEALAMRRDGLLLSS